MTKQITTTLIDYMGSDLTTVNAARVSFGKISDWVHESDDGDIHYDEPTLSDRDTKLIKYLAKHKHLSPFGHAFASFHIKAPIFVARQLVKHKFLRWNEISRRYVDDEPEFYVPDVWRGRSKDKKQGSGNESVDPKIGEDKYLYQAALENYLHLLDCGVAPEMARMVLPTSQMTEWWWSGSLDSWAAMCKLRCAPDTQYESRIVADQISDKMKELFPVSWEALMENN